MNRIFRIRRWNPKENTYDTLFPQTVTPNVLRRENGGVLESFLTAYDHHLFESVRHINHAVSKGNERHFIVKIRNVPLRDGLPLLLTVHTSIECEPDLDFNGTGPKKIVSGTGDPIPGGQVAGTTVFLVWSKRQDAWIMLSCTDMSDMTKILMPVVNEYTYVAEYDNEQLIVIPGYDAGTCMIDINYGQTILRPGIDFEFDKKSRNAIKLLNFSLKKGDILFCKITTFTATAKRGTFKYELDSTDYTVEIKEETTNTVNVPQEAIGTNYLEINYGQTIMRNGIDYELIDSGTQVQFKFDLVKGDVIVFRSIRMVGTNGEIVPNNWGATGNYRYSLNVLHEEYMATEDKITVIPVPNFNHHKDELFVIRDNHLLVYDVDYTIDTLGQVVLLTSHLNTNECIYFTILQGAMMDVPNFNVIDASGDSGQHIHLDMSHSVLCNHYMLQVKLKYDLETAPTAKCIDGPAIPIIDCFGYPVRGGYRAGSYLLLVYSEDHRVWYSLSHSQLDISSAYPVYKMTEGDSNFIGAVPVEDTVGNDPGDLTEVVIEHGLGCKPQDITIRPTEPGALDAEGNRMIIGDVWSYADETYLYVGNTGNATSAFHWIVTTTAQSVDLKAYLDALIEDLKNRPGKFVTRVIAYTAEEDNVSAIPIDGFNAGVDKLLMVNYGQTILREGTDYVLTDTGIGLTQFNLNTGDIVQFVIVVQAED